MRKATRVAANHGATGSERLRQVTTRSATSTAAETTSGEMYRAMWGVTTLSRR